MVLGASGICEFFSFQQVSQVVTNACFGRRTREMKGWQFTGTCFRPIHFQEEDASVPGCPEWFYSRPKIDFYVSQ